MQELSGMSSTGIIVAVVVVIFIIIVIIIAVIVIIILRSKQKKKKNFYASVPNSKGGGNTLIKMGDVEMSGKVTEPDSVYDVVNNIYEAIYSESLNPSSFLGEVSPDESQYSDELCPYIFHILSPPCQYR